MMARPAGGKRLGPRATWGVQTCCCPHGLRDRGPGERTWQLQAAEIQWRERALARRRYEPSPAGIRGTSHGGTSGRWRAELRRTYFARSACSEITAHRRDHSTGNQERVRDVGGGSELHLPRGGCILECRYLDRSA